MIRIIIRNYAQLIYPILFLMFAASQVNASNLPYYKKFGMLEISFESKSQTRFLFPEVIFTQPNGNKVKVDGFYDGENYKVRVYCNQIGHYKWELKGDDTFKRKKGGFEVKESSLRGKLQINAEDPFQFSYHNGDWFLHIGDTGYRYLTDTEQKWQEYIDHAGRLGFTKIRTWFCRSRSNVEALFNDERTSLNLTYWQEMDRRIAFAFENYPEIILQLIPFGEDTDELKRYFAGDSLSFSMLRYAQARFSAYPNIIWCISNDREIVSESVKLTERRILDKNIDKIGLDMVRREPWKTLITNHQSRFMGYSFIDSEWSDIITFESLDEIDGRTIAKYRVIGSDPIVNDEDRYERYREPEYPRYFYRRLMWASLLSGGHATYGGIKTFEAYDNDSIKGMQGYFNIGLEGANDFNNIHKFFNETGLTLVNMSPNDKIVGNSPQQFKCIHNKNEYIIYVANPDTIGLPESPKIKSAEIRNANENITIPAVSVSLPIAQFSLKWFDPETGIWTDTEIIKGGLSNLIAPGPGDWVLYLKIKNKY